MTSVAASVFLRCSEQKALTGAEMVIGLPYDEEIAEFAENSRSILELPPQNPVALKVNEVVQTIKEGTTWNRQ